MRRALIISVVTSMLSVDAQGGQPQNPRDRHAFELPAQSLAASLDAIREQTGIHILYPPDVIGGLSAPHLHGRLTAEEAIAALISGKGLIYLFTNAKTVVIRPLEQPRTTANVRLPTQNPGNERAKPDSAATAIVSDSRVSSHSVQPAFDGLGAKLTFDQSDFDLAGVANVGDFLQARLTSIASPQIYSGIAANLPSVDLRGVGTRSTLILLDGLRLPSILVAGHGQQPDLDGIPLASIERIEVLSAGASSLYGGDAVGGVINIISRRNMDRIESRASFNHTFEAGASDKTVDLIAGRALGDSGIHVQFRGHYSEESPLLVGERDFADRARALMQANDPDAFLSASAPPLASTTNIASVPVFDAATPTLQRPDLTTKDGTQLHAPIAHVLPGSAGAEAGAVFAGHYNLALANTAQTQGGRRQSLRIGRTQQSFGTTLQAGITQRLSAHLDLSAASNIGSRLASAANTTFLLPASSPINPFEQAIEATVPGIGADAMLRSELVTQRIVAGGTFNLTDAWSINTDYVWSRNRFKYTEPASLSPSAHAAVESGAIPIFSDSAHWTSDFSQYAGPAIEAPATDTALQQLLLRADGPVWTLPTGDIDLAVRVERRSEQTTTRAPASPNVFTTPDGSVDVTSIAAQLVLPLNPVTLQLGGRYDDYLLRANRAPADFYRRRFNDFNWNVALRYSPFAGVKVRASYSTADLPPVPAQLVPNLTQVLPAVLLSQLGLTDPLRANEPLPEIRLTSGGNPDLRAEQTKTLAAGVVLTPSWLPTLSLAIDWISIDKQHGIAFVPFAPESLRIASSSSPLIERSAGVLGDAFAVGPVAAYHAQLFNMARQRIEAIDVELTFRYVSRGIGQFTLAARGTSQIHHRAQMAPGAPVEERAGRVDNLRANANLSARWDFDRWSAGWATNFYDDFRLSGDAVSTAGMGLTEVPSQMYHDVFAGYRFFSDTHVQVRIDNALNTAPPNGGSTSLDCNPWGDPRRAYYSLSIRTVF